MQHRISIANPCRENWHSMSPEEKGRHCAVCDKVVYDFTQADRREIIQALRDTGGKICGRIRVSELEKKPSPKVHASPFFRRLAYSLLGFIGFTFFLKKQATAQLHTRSHEPKMNQDTLQKKNTREVVVVVQSHKNLPAANASVLIYAGTALLFEGVSDKNGMVTIQLTADQLPKNEIDVFVFKNHYEKYVSGIYLSRQKQVIRVKLEEQYIEMGDIEFNPMN